jgi:hypothetical protein
MEERMSEPKPTAPTPARPEDVLVYQKDGSIMVKSMELLRNLYGTFPKEGYTATDAEMLEFSHMIQRYGLDPSVKAIQLVVRKQNIGTYDHPNWIRKASPVVGRDIPRAYAQRAGLWNGEEVRFYKDGTVERVEIKVYRKGVSRPYVYDVPVYELTNAQSAFYKAGPEGKRSDMLIGRASFRGNRGAFADLFHGWQSQDEVEAEDRILNPTVETEGTVISTRREPPQVTHKPPMKVSLTESGVVKVEVTPAEDLGEVEKVKPDPAPGLPYEAKPAEPKPTPPPRRKLRESPPMFGKGEEEKL